MPACSRSDVVLEGEAHFYHVWTRCVRRACLFGGDEQTVGDYSYRRTWIHLYLVELCRLFAVEVNFHAKMKNHLHFLLWTRPDIVELWSDEEVVRRWMAICRLIRSEDGKTIRELEDSEVQARLRDAEKVAQIRKNLSSVSQFMKALCEHIARRANLEDGVSGAFFESRFGCRRIENEAGIVICGMYIDLNEIRTGDAETPETSTHTSAYDRIVALRQQAEGVPPENRADCWLSEFFLDPRSDAYVAGPQPSVTGKRASDKGILPMRFEDYLRLLDWVGRQLARDKPGAIPKHLAPILDRLGMAATQAEQLLNLVANFDNLFTHVVGTSQQLIDGAAATGRRYFRGRPVCEAAFG